ncbi:MAG TPA: class I SAM-dependent methyltransferase [Aggregatilineales bacterium]|nr:class I SAM-dependent methyltransferase [Aggregatilineales bacterium]
MQQTQAGITALVTAYARAYHATHDSPKIFDDFLADQLYTPEEHSSFDHNLAEMVGTLESIAPDVVASKPDPATALAAVIQFIHGPVTLSRSRYTEDCLVDAIAQGVRQYVILGAGFDTFAFRQSDLLEKLEVFEVDHPVTQAMKRQRIGMAGWEIPTKLHFVPVDFNSEKVADALLRSSFDPRAQSFFSWLGVTYYLAREVVFDTLKAIADITAQGSTVVFDYMDTDAFIPEKAAKRIQLMQAGARRVGEPMQTGFDPAVLADDLRHAGLTLEENLSPMAIEERYFRDRTDRYHAYEHVHFARVQK